jgi:hypothetical protein
MCKIKPSSALVGVFLTCPREGKHGKPHTCPNCPLKKVVEGKSTDEAIAEILFLEEEEASRIITDYVNMFGKCEWTDKKRC